MAGYDWNFSVLEPYAWDFLVGTGLTLGLSLLSFGLGTLTGTATGVALRRWQAARVVWAFNDAVRALPPLVLLLMVYFFPFPRILGIPAPPPFWTAVIAFSVSQAAYSAELTRAALAQVPTRSILSGLSIGLDAADLWRFVILPDIARQMMPAQIAFFIGIVRLSNLASVIGCQEVVFVARRVSSQAFRSFEPWLLVAAIYIALVLPVTVALRAFEKSAWLARRN